MAEETKKPEGAPATDLTDRGAPATNAAAAATGAGPASLAPLDDARGAPSPSRGAPGAPKPAAPATPKPAAPAAAAPAAAKPAPKPAAPIPDFAGKTTTPVAPSVAAAKPATGRAADDTSPLLTRRAWIGLAWGAFTAASAGALAATGRFMFPNVLNEPPQQFKAGFPGEYGMGVDERWKEKFGVWLVRTPEDIVHGASGFYAILSTCTHLGCTPNYLSAEGKFKCPCHGSGFRLTGINFEGPAPRPLERARIVLAEDGQILVDKSRKFQQELGQWIDPEAFLKV